MALGLASGGSASAEQEVIFYSSIGGKAQQVMLDALKKKLPDIKVNWVGGGGVGIFRRLVSERLAGAGKIDLFTSSHVGGFAYLDNQGWVDGSWIKEVSEIDRIPKGLRDPRGNWLPLRVSLPVIFYRTDRISAEEAPKGWKDWLNPKWKGRIVVSDPNESAGTFAWFYTTKEKFGAEYLEKLFKQQGMTIKGRMANALDATLTGEADIAMAFEYFPVQEIQKGAKLRIVFPEEGTPTVPAPIVLLKDAPNRAAAVRLLRYLFTKEAQELMVKTVQTYSPRSDVVPPEGLRPLSELKTWQLDWHKIGSDLERITEEINRIIRGR